MEKTIEQIKEEVARGHGYPNWIDFINDQPNYNVELIMNEVATLYAQQFQTPTDALNVEIMVLRERVEESQQVLTDIVHKFENTSISSSDILMHALGKAKQLINSPTQPKED